MRRGALGLVSALVLLSTGVVAAQEAVPKCGVAQLKVSQKVIDVLIGEGVAACVAGFAGNPAPVNAGKITAAVEKGNQALQKAIDKFGQPNCFQSPAEFLLPADAIQTASEAAASYCLVEVP